MYGQTITLTPTLYQYLLEYSLHEPPILRELREETSTLPRGEMQIAPEQGQFISLLIRLMGARRCIEVGVYTGYSSLSVALALPPNGEIVACDIDRQPTEIARRYWQKAGVSGRISLQIGPAMDTLDGLIVNGGEGHFDFAFIDADKVNYLGYFERCLTLLHSGGLIVVDNTLWSGTVADPEDHSVDAEALRCFNEALHQDARIYLSLLPIGDGMTLALKR